MSFLMSEKDMNKKMVFKINFTMNKKDMSTGKYPNRHQYVVRKKIL